MPFDSGNRILTDWVAVLFILSPTLFAHAVARFKFRCKEFVDCSIYGIIWKVVVDEKTPSVRTNERPYKRGENFRTVIDGFVISPNVGAKSVETTDFDFEYTDHHPVTAEFYAVEAR